MSTTIFSELWLGDRFKCADTGDVLWTKIAPDAARKHSPQSQALGERGFGYCGDVCCSFEPNLRVVFEPVGAAAPQPGATHPHVVLATLAFAAVIAACVSLALVPFLVNRALPPETGWGGAPQFSGCAVPTQLPVPASAQPSGRNELP